MGVPGFLNISDKKKSVYVVENGPPSPQPNFSPVGTPRIIRAPLSSRSAAKVVACFEVMAALVFWFPLLNVMGYIDAFFDARVPMSSLVGADNPMGVAVIGIVARLIASVILLIGTYTKSSWFSVPYLMVQMTLLIGGPFIFIYSSLGYDPERMSDDRQMAASLVMLLFLLIFIWIEYAKWRIVYGFYDSVSSKNVSSEFARMLDNEPQNRNDIEKQPTLDAESYLKQVYTSAQMQEIDPKEVESLLPLQPTDEPSKKFSFDNVKLELKE